jgi:hypothetical protein
MLLLLLLVSDVVAETRMLANAGLNLTGATRLTIALAQYIFPSPSGDIYKRPDLSLRTFFSSSDEIVSKPVSIVTGYTAVVSNLLSYYEDLRLQMGCSLPQHVIAYN